MPNNFLITNEYQDFITSIKQNIQDTRIKTIRSVNSELINLYLNLGKQISEKQKQAKWGDDLIAQIEIDLRLEYPEMTGLSRRNLFYMKKIYEFMDSNNLVQQPVALIPWGHNIVLIDKIKDPKEFQFYVQKTIQNSWSRAVLINAISLGLHQRQGNIVNNFETTIEPHQIEMVSETFKDPYIFEFLDLGDNYKERELENALVDNLSKLLLELGQGFAFVGRQYKLTVSEREFFVDLLFYHTILKRYVIIELKTTEFKPEYAGQLNFYITAIDEQVKQNDDNSTIGIIICQDKDNLIVEYSLKGQSQPIGVAGYQLTSELPKELEGKLPTANQLKRLGGIKN